MNGLRSNKSVAIIENIIITLKKIENIWSQRRSLNLCRNKSLPFF